MHRQQAAVLNEKHIFALAIDGANAVALGLAATCEAACGFVAMA